MKRAHADPHAGSVRSIFSLLDNYIEQGGVEALINSSTLTRSARLGYRKVAPWSVNGQHLQIYLRLLPTLWKLFYRTLRILATL
jgi:hypothetical protein